VFVIAQFAVTLVAVDAVTVQVTPVPDTVIAVAPPRSLPVRVTGTTVLWVPEEGLIEVSVGPCTVEVTVPLLPGMATVLAVSPAEAETVNVAVAVVGEVTVKLLTVTPRPDTVGADAPVKLVPVNVTGTEVPR
jgi:hypothetical protein